MILIRSREEYRRHLENQLAMLEAQRKTASKKSRAVSEGTWDQGAVAGLTMALEALRAWEDYDEAQLVSYEG